MRAATAARLGLGGACLVLPKVVLGLIGGADRDDRPTARVVRVLGARLLLQGALDGVLDPHQRRLGLLVEVSHAVSMLPVATCCPLHRRTALASAGLAAAVATLDLYGTRPSSYRSPEF